MKTIKLEPEPVTSLVLDYDVTFPRGNIDSTHIRHLAEALAAGATMPPVIADKKSRRVIDGFHRCKAALLHGGPHAEVTVEWRTYRDEKAMLREAGELNSTHGKPLDRYDRLHFMAKARRLGMKDQEIAKSINMTLATMQKIMKERMAKTESGKPEPIKNTIKHKAGDRLTEGQVEANRKLGGNNPGFYANQILMLVQNDLIDRENESVMARLHELHEALGEFLDV